jgi:bis(5'-adenosyl)-triphosphatase
MDALRQFLNRHRVNKLVLAFSKGPVEPSILRVLSKSGFEIKLLAKSQNIFFGTDFIAYSHSVKDSQNKISVRFDDSPIDDENSCPPRTALVLSTDCVDFTHYRRLPTIFLGKEMSDEKSIPSFILASATTISDFTKSLLGSFIFSPDEPYTFGPFGIPKSHVFAVTRYCYAFVNLKPVVDGHVLISPRRPVLRWNDLTPEEVCDIWLFAQEISRQLEAEYRADGFSIAVQDGAVAGQTVPHVHVHILPRHSHDIENNDDVYQYIEESSMGAPPVEDACTPETHSLPVDGRILSRNRSRVPDSLRTPRESAAMTNEASRLRSLFKQLPGQEELS